jgi:transcriptional regulator with XRE-family HTH domain
MINNITQICSRIDLIRRQQNWTQEQMAEALQISQPAISKYLKNRIPPADILLKLARAGNTTIEWLLTGQKNYYFNINQASANEPGVEYDADFLLAKKIAGLPAHVRNAITTLIEFAESQRK